MFNGMNGLEILNSWPRYESGELVELGDGVSVTVHDEDGDFDRTFAIRSIKYEESGVLLEGTKNEMVILSYGERVKRPSVLAADGEPLEVGQTVWRDDGEELEVLYLRPDGLVDCCGQIERPESLTHQRPVLDADGVPIKVGDTVYEVGENYPAFVVDHLPEPGAYRSVRVVYPSGAFTGLDPERLTHTKPEIDSWERVEEDAENVAKLFDNFDADASEDIRSIVRRCKALAEKENRNE